MIWIECIFNWFKRTPRFYNQASILMLFPGLSGSKNKQIENLEYKNSFIGLTGPTESDYGETISSVAPPFAMTQWCAMTRENNISQNPHNYNDSVLIGFIGTRQPVIWMGDYGYASFHRNHM